MKIHLFNDNILVSEATDDLLVNGVVARYDSDNPYMFCKVENMSDEIDEDIQDKILIIKRYAKEEYLPGYYFVSLKDVRGYLTQEDYNKLKVE